MSTPRLLVVDDDSDVMFALESELSDRYQVFATDSPVRALQMAQAESFDLLVTDVRMPQLTGIELSALAQQAQPDLPTVFVSAYNDSDATDAILERPGCFKVNKPWHDALQVIVERALEYRALRNSQQGSNPASQRVAMLGLRAAGLVHDLRNHLATLGLNLDIALPSLELAVTTLQQLSAAPNLDRRSMFELSTLVQEQCVASVRESIDVMSRIHDLVASSVALIRGEGMGGAASLELAVEKAIAQVQAMLPSHIQSKLQPGLCVVMAEVNLTRVVSNLLFTAARASQPRDGEILVRTWSEDDLAYITVEDSGPGLDPVRALRLGDPTQPTSVDGSLAGLGLSVCSDLLLSAGGCLRWRRRSGGGSMFVARMVRSSDAA
ncbi:MAG: response regulator [Pseudomonadota bacterium]